MMDMRLALAIARAGSIGCSSGDALDALAALSSLCECSEEGEDSVNGKMKGRALGCAACLARWGRPLAFLDSFDVVSNQAMSSDTRFSEIEQLLGLTPAQSIEQLIQAAALGDSFATTNLSICSWHGHVLPQSLGNSVQLLQQAAGTGNAHAMFNLAVCFEKGDGVPQDKAKALQLYQQAAELGNTHAMVVLGLCFQKGNSVAQDKAKAVRLYKKSSRLGQH